MSLLLLLRGGAGISYSLSLSGGTITVSGGSISFGRGRNLSLSSGSLTVFGQSSTLNHGRALSLSDGTLTVTGGDATLTKTGAQSYVLSLDGGVISVSGGTTIFSWEQFNQQQLVSAVWLFWQQRDKRNRKKDEEEQQVIEEVVSEVVKDTIMEIANRTDIPPVKQLITEAKQKAKDKEYYQAVQAEVSPAIIRDVQKQVAQELRVLVAKAQEQEDEERAIIELMMELM